MEYYLMKECYITYFCKINSVSKPAYHFPDIYALKSKFVVTEITVPTFVKVGTLIK